MRLRELLGSHQSQESLIPRKHVPWIASPLEKDNHRATEHGQHDHPEGHHGAKSRLRENTRAQLEFDSSSDEHPKHHLHNDTPHFKKHHEASSIELFYDLFFVANLATFTANAEISDGPTLASYVGFMTLMWFTWLQTSLFDVRFGTESVFSRICKACSFGVMTGFAIVGPQFRTYEVEKYTRAFRSMSLILMTSRLILMLQYGVVLYYLRPYWKKTFVPLTVIMATLLVAAVIFLGLFFDFQKDEESKGYVGWYVVVGVEAFVTIATSSKWRIIGFKHTHLVERVGLLTLIIMGEGIIGMTKAVTYIMKGSTYLSSSVIGQIICAVLIIYFLWMLYFDQIEHERFGTIRQQVWTLLHYPLHIAILLTVEGSTQFIKWWIANDNSNWALTKIGDSWQSSETGDQLVGQLKVNLEEIAGRFNANGNKDAKLPDFSSQFKLMANYTDTDEENERVVEIVSDMGFTLYSWACGIYGIKPDEEKLEGSKDPTEKLLAIYEIFWVVFIFFFSCAGAVLLILAIMYWFGKSHKSGGEWASIGVRVFFGLGVTLLAIMAKDYSDAWVNYITSPWILPTVVFVYGIANNGLVIALDNLLVWFSNRHLAIHGHNTMANAISYGEESNGGHYVADNHHAA
ncbi:MAG: hypothetical protein Q9160_008654 [Pyrenula sp. 1 TL-2023]